MNRTLFLAAAALLKVAVEGQGQKFSRQRENVMTGYTGSLISPATVTGHHQSWKLMLDHGES